jgi:hypothetical protein
MVDLINKWVNGPSAEAYPHLFDISSRFAGPETTQHLMLGGDRTIPVQSPVQSLVQGLKTEVTIDDFRVL